MAYGRRGIVVEWLGRTGTAGRKHYKSDLYTYLYR